MKRFAGKLSLILSALLSSHAAAAELGLDQVLKEISARLEAPTAACLAETSPLPQIPFSNRRGSNLCGSGTSGIWSEEELDTIINRYEAQGDSALRQRALHRLTQSPTNEQRNAMSRCGENDLHCRLRAYWAPAGEGSEEIAKRALALFYATDGGIAIQGPRSGGAPAGATYRYLNLGQVRSVERTLRRIPPHLREVIFRFNGDRGIRIEGIDDPEASPAQASSAAVSLSRRLDAYRAGMRPNRGKTLQQDTRPFHIMHEFGHLSSMFLPMALNEARFSDVPLQQFTSNYRVSDDSLYKRVIAANPRKLIARPWDGIFYCGALSRSQPNVIETCNLEEVFAEHFAHYVYHPELFESRYPALYGFFKERIFNGIEFDGFSACR